MKKVLKWLTDHLILTWAIFSVIFAFIVHMLFSIIAPNQWMVAKWGAGDILTYASTIALGLLAVWQNRKFKHENDIAQERLEKITIHANELAIHANELTVISKIIEYESNNLLQLRKAFDEFSTVCDPQIIASIYSEGVDSNDELSNIRISASMAKTEKQIDDSFFAITRELNTIFEIRTDDKNPLKLAVTKYYCVAKKIVENLSKNPRYNSSKDLEILKEARSEFMKLRESLLFEKVNTLNRAIYGNMTLNEIKKLFHAEIT